MCVALQLFHTPLWVWDTLPFATNIYTLPLYAEACMQTCHVNYKSGHDLFDCDHIACGFMSYPVRRLIIQSVLMCECEMNEWMNNVCDSQTVYQHRRRLLPSLRSVGPYSERLYNGYENGYTPKKSYWSTGLSLNCNTETFFGSVTVFVTVI